MSRYSVVPSVFILYSTTVSYIMHVDDDIKTKNGVLQQRNAGHV